jgi:hypothetical protein
MRDLGLSMKNQAVLISGTWTVLLLDSSVWSQDLMVSSVMKISRIFENIIGTSVLIIWTYHATNEKKDTQRILARRPSQVKFRFTKGVEGPMIYQRYR